MSAIEHAEQELRRLVEERASGWIKTSERLPEVFAQGDDIPDRGSEIVLAHWPNGWIGTAQYWEGDGGWFWVEQDDAQEADADPTHWMPLPAAPTP